MAALVVVAALTACGSSRQAPPPAPPPPPPPAAPAAPVAPVAPGESRARAPAPAALPAPVRARNWDAFQRQAAERIVAANPGRTYAGPPPEVLLAIPVLEIHLDADGQVRRIDVLRRPGQAPDTTQLAIDAVRRAAPFGDVRHLPRPWRFAEVFLFDDDRRFKPRTLDD
jgi:hypothetical protein